MRVLAYLTSLLLASATVGQQVDEGGIRVRSLTLRGNTVLASSEKQRLIREITSGTYKNIEQVSERVLIAYQDRGYFKTTVYDPVLREQSQDGVDLVVTVKEGRQYRLGALKITNAKELPPNEIRKQFPISPGDVFSKRLVQRGFENIRRLYESSGYPNSTLVPNTQLDEQKGLIELSIDMDEGKLFHWGKLSVEGKEAVPGAKEKLLSAWVAHEGQVYDSERTLRAFLIELGAAPGVVPEDVFRCSFDQGSRLVNVEITLSEPPNL